MIYEIRHRTTYEYDSDVSLSHHVARLTAWNGPLQRRIHHAIEADPQPAGRSIHTDHYGNLATFLTFEGPHRRLEIQALNTVELSPPPAIQDSHSADWEQIRDAFAGVGHQSPFEVSEFLHGSPMVPRRPEFVSYAKESFPRRTPVLCGAMDLMKRIHRDLIFDTRATNVTTPVQEVFKNRRGVCQDFAQLMIACLRSIGLPARYVSGYLETEPVPGQVKLVGADATHAWVSIWCGSNGWIDLDPTNGIRPSERHVVIAVGRDFLDVSPIRGVIVGSGSHHLTVGVDVVPVKA